jgi:hypothetical protein
MKARMIAVMMSVVLLALPVALCAQEPDAMSVINAWLEALNAGDIDTALSHLADDAVVQIVPPAPGTSGVFSGKEEIRGWYENLLAQHGVGTLSDCQVDGENVTCVNTYAEDSLRSLGLDSIVGEWVAVVREGKLQSYTFTQSDESLAAMMAAMTPPVMAETGGSALPICAIVAILGGLIGAGGLGLGMLQSGRRRVG